MAIPKSKKNVGLGQAIIKARFKGRSRPRDGDERLVSTTLTTTSHSSNEPTVCFYPKEQELTWNITLYHATCLALG